MFIPCEGYDDSQSGDVDLTAIRCFTAACRSRTVRRMTTITHPHTLSSGLASSGLGAKALVPGDLAWDGARQAWNLSVDQRPAAVVFPEDVSDVVATVRTARSVGASIVVQGTGHGAASYDDLSNAILVRTTRLRAIDIRNGACVVQAGALWGEVAHEAAPYGMAPLSGSSPDVGVVGYSLGGGIGWLSRKYGLAANAIRRIDIVTADGELRRVDHSHDQDLFWALRGGGGGFGVVIGIEFDLMPVSTVYGGTLAWNAEHAPALFRAWAEWTASLDDSITSIIRFLNLPAIPEVPEPFRGRRVVTLGAVGVGDPDGVAVEIAKMRAVASPILDAFGPMPVTDLVRLHGDPEGPTPGMSHHALLSDLPARAIDELEGVAGGDSGSKLISAEIRHLGGALARPASGGGVLSHIPAPYSVMGVGMAADPDQHAESHRELGALIDAFQPWTAGAYLNFAERATDTPFDSGTNAALAAIRTRIDPTGMFQLRTNQHFHETGTQPRKNRP